MTPPARARISGYQWFVFAVAGGAWLFDNLDQRTFSLSRIPALANLMSLPGGDVHVQGFAKVVTALFLVGWGLGGLTIGALGDRFGRARLLGLSVLTYALGAGLTAVSADAHLFAVLRFVSGFGIGGVFGLAVTLIAETFSGATRVAMLAGLQILSTVGNVSAALVKMGADVLAAHAVLPADQVWRYVFGLSAVLAAGAAAAAFFLKETDSWIAQRDAGRLPTGVLGAYRDLLADRRERRGLLIGALLASAGVVGLWAIGEYAIDLQDAVFTGWFAAREPATHVKTDVAQAKNLAYLLQMLGGAGGMLAFSWVVNRFGRRPAFIGGFLAALVVTPLVYWRLSSPMDAYWMMPMMGAAQLSVFAGFSIYLPELFGAHARGTGVSFCYNLGRFAAAGGSFLSATLTTVVYAGFASPLPLRYAAMTMSVVFVGGVAAAIAAPETRGVELRA